MIDITAIKHNLIEDNIMIYTQDSFIERHVMPLLDNTFKLQNISEYINIFNDNNTQKIFIATVIIYYLRQTMERRKICKYIDTLQDFDIYMITKFYLYKFECKNDSCNDCNIQDIINNLQIKHLSLLYYISRLHYINGIFYTDILDKIMSLCFKPYELNVLYSFTDVQTIISLFQTHRNLNNKKDINIDINNARIKIMYRIFLHYYSKFSNPKAFIELLLPYFSKEMAYNNLSIHAICKYNLLNKTFINNVYNTNTYEYFATLNSYAQQHLDYIKSLKLIDTLQERTDNYDY